MSLMLTVDCAAHWLIIYSSFWQEFGLATMSIFIMFNIMTQNSTSGIGIHEYFVVAGYTFYIMCKLYAQVYDLTDFALWMYAFAIVLSLLARLLFVPRTL